MAGPQPPRSSTERGFAMIAGAIVAASLVIYWGMPEEPRYQLTGSGSAVVRLDTDSGEMIACNGQSCARLIAPDRAKTIGAITIQRGDDQKKLPAPTNSQ